MMELQPIIEAVSQFGGLVILVGYMVYKDLNFTNKINDMLVNMKDTLDVIKETAEEKEAILSVLEQLNEKLNKE